MFWTPDKPPTNYIRTDVPTADRGMVIGALTSGRPIEYYLGWGICRICGVVLGTADMEVHDLVYPEGAEHYLLEHQVWTPGCEELLARIKRRSSKTGRLYHWKSPPSAAESIDSDLQGKADKDRAAQ